MVSVSTYGNPFVELIPSVTYFRQDLLFNCVLLTYSVGFVLYNSRATQNVNCNVPICARNNFDAKSVGSDIEISSTTELPKQGTYRAKGKAI